jgi:hypothetical protein
MHGVDGQAPRTEGRPEYKTEAAEEVIGGQEQETPDDRDIFLEQDRIGGIWSTTHSDRGGRPVGYALIPC